MKVKYQGKLPAQNHSTDAGYDLRALCDVVIPSFASRLVRTGFNMRMPDGYAGLVCSRSGLAHKHNVIVLNSPGIIDCHYTGDVGVILYNSGIEDFEVKAGDRIAQLVFISVEHPVFEEGELEETARGDKGFGSSGK